MYPLEKGCHYFMSYVETQNNVIFNNHKYNLVPIMNKLGIYI